MKTMKTTILGMTTAIALALPAVAQTGVETTVQDVLEQQGYPAGTIDMLSEGQIAEVYVVATSENASDVNRVLSGYELGDDEMMAVSTGPSGVEQTVADVLETNGYSADMVNALSSGDIANIYAAETSGDETQVMDAISSAIEASGRTVADDPSAVEKRAMTYLSRAGYSMDEIEGVTEAELVSIYTALTSGNASDIDSAVSAALEAS